MIDWNIQSRAHACQGCHTHFQNKQPLHTVLFDHRHGYERLDLCESCWIAQRPEASDVSKDFISHWQGVYTPPPAAPPDAIQKEDAETLLRKLLELNKAEHLAVRYILAVMLERKRLLKVKAQLKQDGQRIFVYEHPKTGDLFNITDPELQLNQLEEVQRDVAYLLEHGFSNPGETQASSEPPSVATLNPEAIPVTEAQPVVAG